MSDGDTQGPGAKGSVHHGRAHRMGPPLQDRQSPKPVIVRYLNYVDRTNILQKFRTQASLKFDGYRLLLFADYLAELSKKRRTFTPVCSQLHLKKIKFAQTYPAVLRILMAEGQQQSFEDPEEAKQFLAALEEQTENLPQEQPREGRPPNTPMRLPRKHKERSILHRREEGAIRGTDRNEGGTRSQMVCRRTVKLIYSQ